VVMRPQPLRGVEDRRLLTGKRFQEDGDRLAHGELRLRVLHLASRQLLRSLLGDETPTAPPELIDAQVPGDADEPRLARPIAAAGWPERVEREENPLRQARWARGWRRSPAEDLEDRTPVALEQKQEGSAVAPGAPFHEFLVRGRHARDPLQLGCRSQAPATRPPCRSAAASLAVCPAPRKDRRPSPVPVGTPPPPVRQEPGARVRSSRR